MLAITTWLTLTASVGTTRSQHVEGDQSMAEMTRPGPLAKVRLIDSASVLTAPHGAQIAGDLGCNPATGTSPG
jgi:hypothetical protein